VYFSKRIFNFDKNKMINRLKKRIEIFESKYPYLYKAIALIFGIISSCFFVNNYFSLFGSTYLLQSEDEADTKKLAGRRIETVSANEAGPSKDKSSNPSSYNPTYRVGSESPGPGKPSALEDMQLRLEKLMLDSTQNFIDQSDSEIRSKNLHTKDESELTPEEVTLLKQRESHIDHMAKTSANVLTKESEPKTSEKPVDPNINKRDVKSADLDSDQEDSKKRK
jgi:hypothetical protein